MITLLTDFGVRDSYAASMKGAILSVFPGAVISDASHEIEPFDVASAAFVLSSYISDFPAGTAHIAVVDPGVGSNRKAIAIRTAFCYIVCPDNGIAALALRDYPDYEAYEIDPERLPQKCISSTFHGRDIFSPAAALLASGKDIASISRRIDRIFVPDFAEPEIKNNIIRGCIIHIDRFGNLITNISAGMLSLFNGKPITIKAGNKLIAGISNTYSDKAPGEPVAYLGSGGLLEIAIVEGNAAAFYKNIKSVDVFVSKGK